MAGKMGRFDEALAVIYDSNNEFITKTVVTGHDKSTMYISVAHELKEVKTGARLNVLIVHPSGASEFGGILRRARTAISQCEISLFGEKQRYVRASRRHTLNIPAVVNDLIINDQEESFIEPLPITIEDLSSTGIRIKSHVLRFEVGHTLKVEFSLKGRDAIIVGQIRREQVNDDNSFSYGCQLIFPK